MTDLRRAVAERKAEVAEKDLVNKAKCIAARLGKSCKGGDDSEGSESSFFDKKNIHINSSLSWQADRQDVDTSFSLTIEYDGDIVLRVEKNNVTAYIPGSWEEIIEALYPQAEEIERAIDILTVVENSEEQKAKLERERAKWGL